MLLIDNLVVSPASFVLWVLRQVHRAAQEELDHEAERIPLQLAELHRLLEAGQIGEQEFDARERALLARLDELEQGAASR